MHNRSITKKMKIYTTGQTKPVAVKKNSQEREVQTEAIKVLTWDMMGEHNTSDVSCFGGFFPQTSNG